MPDISQPGGTKNSTQEITNAVWANDTQQNAGGGIDWSSKTPKYEFGTQSGNPVVSVSGSGYITSISANDVEAPGTPQLGVKIDGTTLVNDPGIRTLDGALRIDETHNNTQTGVFHFRGVHRFDSSFTVEETGGQDELAANVSYVLD